MTATGTPSAASRTVLSTLSGVAPASRASREASWITPPSITGSENGMPTSTASAPAASSPRSTSASNPGAPPVTYGTNTRPPPSIRARSAVSSLGTRRRPERPADRFEVLAPPAGQVHEHERAIGQRAAQQPADRVRGLKRREDALEGGERGEPLERLRVGRRHVLP